MQASIAAKLLRHRANIHILYPVPEHRQDIHVGAQGDLDPQARVFGGNIWVGKRWEKADAGLTSSLETLLWFASCGTPKNTLDIGTTPGVSLPPVCRVFNPVTRRLWEGCVYCVLRTAYFEYCVLRTWY